MEFGFENPSYEIRGNTVNVIFGINLPLIYPFLYNLRIFGSSMKSDFIKNEIRIRRGKYDAVDVMMIKENNETPDLDK